MSPNRLRMLAVVASLLAGCGGAAELPVQAPPATSLASGSGLSPADDIDGADVDAAADGSVHVVWRERRHGDADAERIVYRHGAGTPLRWDPAGVVAGRATGKPRVVAARDGIHVVAGYRLHHWWLPTGNGVVHDLGELLGEEDPIAADYDAIATDDGFLVAYVTSDASADQSVHGVRWRPEGGDHAVVLAHLPQARSAGRLAPVLSTLGDRLLLLWVQRTLEERYDSGIGMKAVSVAEHVHAAWSDDGGSTWSAPAGVDVDTSTTGNVEGVAAGGTAEAPAVFMAADGMFVSRRQHGTWSRPEPIAADGAKARGTMPSSGAAAARCRGRTLLAWVDARYRRSDRRWWNPLGGFPWSDNPDWVNNDLFLVPIPDDGLSGPLAQPRRLTPAGGQVADVALAARGKAPVLVRVFRASVGKSRDDRGSPPQLLASQLSCD